MVAPQPGTGPSITVARKSGRTSFYKAVTQMQRMAAYVGVPAENNQRTDALTTIAGRSLGKSASAKNKRARATKEAASGVTNAELLYIHSKGSPLRNIQPRPVVEPAIQAEGNRQAIANELAETAKLALAGKPDAAKKRLKRAAIAGQNAARKWFTDPRNGWPPNAASTIRRKGSDRPMIDFAVLRNAIVGITREDK